MREASSYGTGIFPATAPRGEHEVRILRLAERAVVAPQRAEVVSLLQVHVVAQDRAAIGQVGPQVKEIMAGPADELDPERHHLHVAASAGARDRVLAKTA